MSSCSPWDAIRLPSGLTSQVEDLMFVASQHGDPPARGRIPQANLAIQADDEPPTIRCEDRGDLAARAQRRTAMARPVVASHRRPESPIQRADPLSIRAVSQPLDPFLMPAQYRHFFSCRRVPETNGLIGGTGGKAFAVRTVRQRINGAFMPAQGADRPYQSSRPRR